MLTIEERIALLSARLRLLSYEQVRQDFERKFHKPAPTRANIRMLVNKFKRTGSVVDEKRSGRPQTSANDVELIQQAIERSPGASTRRLSNELDIPRTTVWRVLRFTLKKRAYHLQVLHHLEQEDYAARQAMCHDLLQAVANEDLMNNILFSDEATFHICGRVNRHNCRIWADEQPNATYEWQRDTPKINVWLGVSATKLYGPFMFQEPTVTGVTYLEMLQQFLEPQLTQDGVLHSVVFQQDGAPPHFALCVRAYLNETFPGRWIGRAAPRMWAPRSPDITPLDFFAWGFIKSHVYKNKVRDLPQLRERIYEAVAAITPQHLRSVFRATVQRWEQCLEMQGGQIELY
ncbi:hypothetical protein C0J52_02021 [Blattella germanica]|nr:hypothetical protein C0J52_02021 [Blattella germanica]PSN58024.1 hypothetical protein C0J52_02021 [Blattella germanica]